MKNYFTHGRFSEVGQKQNMEREKKKRTDGYNNGQATHGARKLPRPKVVDLIIFGVILG